MKRQFASLCAVLAMASALMSFTPQAQAKDGNEDKENEARIVGTVSSIDLEKKAFTVSNAEGVQTIVLVAPDTKFKVKQDNGAKTDTRAALSDLKVNDWVKVKTEQTLNAGPLAHGVKIYR